MAVELLTNVYSVDCKPNRFEDVQNDDNEDVCMDEEDTDAIDENFDDSDALSEDSEEDAYDMMLDDALPIDNPTSEIIATSNKIDSLLAKLVKFVEFKITPLIPSSAKNIVSLLYSVESGALGAIGNIINKCAPSLIKSNASELWQWSFDQGVKSQEPFSFDDGTNLEAAYAIDLFENVITLIWSLTRRISLVDKELIVTNPILF